MGFFDNPYEDSVKQAGRETTAQFHDTADAYEAYRPAVIDARVNALNQALSMFQGPNRMLGMMYGPLAKSNIPTITNPFPYGSSGNPIDWFGGTGTGQDFDTFKTNWEQLNGQEFPHGTLPFESGQPPLSAALPSSGNYQMNQVGNSPTINNYNPANNPYDRGTGYR